MLDELRAAAPGQTIYDRGEKASIKGLHLRVASDGTKSFYLFYRTRAGQQRRPKIGELGEITLSEARRRARAILDRVAIGEDPKAEWQEQKAELTVAALFEKAWDEHWSKPRFERSGWGKQVKWLWARSLRSTFGPLKLSEVTPTRVRQWHQGFASTSVYNGNRSLKVLSKIFRYAEEIELRPQNSNPCNLVKVFPEHKRSRYATADEIKKVIAILDRDAKKYPASVAFIYLLMFSGARPSVIARARWDQLQEFEVNGAKWGMLQGAGKTSSKTGSDDKTLLPPQAMRVIGWLPRVEGMTITGMKMPRTLWRRVREEAGCPDLWVRDWRRTFATLGYSDGVDMWTVGELLNHRSTETTKIYAKMMDTRRLEAVTRIADKIESFSKDKTG